TEPRSPTLKDLSNLPVDRSRRQTSREPSATINHRPSGAKANPWVAPVLFRSWATAPLGSLSPSDLACSSSFLPGSVAAPPRATQVRTRASQEKHKKHPRNPDMSRPSFVQFRPL